MLVLATPNCYSRGAYYGAADTSATTNTRGHRTGFRIVIAVRFAVSPPGCQARMGLCALHHARRKVYIPEGPTVKSLALKYIAVATMLVLIGIATVAVSVLPHADASQPALLPTAAIRVRAAAATVVPRG